MNGDGMGREKKRRLDGEEKGGRKEKERGAEGERKGGGRRMINKRGITRENSLDGEGEWNT